MVKIKLRLKKRKICIGNKFSQKIFLKVNIANMTIIFTSFPNSLSAIYLISFP